MNPDTLLSMLQSNSKIFLTKWNRTRRTEVMTSALRFHFLQIKRVLNQRQKPFDIVAFNVKFYQKELRTLLVVVKKWLGRLHYYIDPSMST